MRLRPVATRGFSPKPWASPTSVSGFVALKTNGRNAREYLDAWIARRFPNGARTGYTVGGVIVHTTIKKTYADGVMIAGMRRT